jgi:hypothetical protein
MKLFLNKSLSAGLVIWTAVCGCSNNNLVTGKSAARPLDSLNFTVELAGEWTSIFKRTSGWFGGDGIFVIPQNGNDNAPGDSLTILFSDTMVGEIEGDSLKPGFVMTHNSVATTVGKEPGESAIKFHWDKKAGGAPESVFIPSTPATKPGDYYWLGDGFVNTELNNNTYIFGYRVKDIKVTSGFTFEQVGNTLIIIPKGSKPPYKEQRQMDVPFFIGGNDTNAVSFGSAVFVNTTSAGARNPDGFVYVYGVGGNQKNLVVARVRPAGFEQLGTWRFWNGRNWVPEIQAAADITNHVSNELSLSELPDGRFALVFQVDGISPIVGMRIGESPVGPFGPIINLYDCRKDLNSGKIFAYNAKAHPALSKAGELLVSYNVNSMDFENDIKRFPNLYRPRFIRIKFL